MGIEIHHQIVKRTRIENNKPEDEPEDKEIEDKVFRLKDKMWKQK